MRRAIAAVLVAASLTAADPPAPVAGAWTDTFTMAIRDVERTFVRHAGEAWMQVLPAELKDPSFMAGKDMLFTAKLRVAPTADDAERVRLYGVDLPIVAPATVWAARVPGDNLHVFARGEIGAKGPQLKVVLVEPAASDRSIIDARMAGVAKDDWQGRLAVANWVREQATVSAARDAWLAAGDDLVVAVIDDAAQSAEQNRDAALIEQAVGWCLGMLNDPGRAARLASAAWLQTTDAKIHERLTRRMRGLGFAQYKGQWRPAAEALSSEFEDRFNATDWRDAQAFYVLGRWVDANAEQMPRAKDAAWRAYQTGLRANPRHNGIRRELGLPPDTEGGATTAGTAGTVAAAGNADDLADAATGIVVRIPETWKRNDTLGGRAGFVDPGSDTAYITVTLVPLPATATFDQIWTSQIEPLRNRDSFHEDASSDETFSGGAARRASYSWKEGGQDRRADIALALNPRAKTAVRIDARYEAEEAERVRAIVAQLFGRMIIPTPAGMAAGPATAAPAADAAPSATPRRNGPTAP
jgi:hypothetical protein